MTAKNAVASPYNQHASARHPDAVASGLCCKPGGFPYRSGPAVERAVITTATPTMRGPAMARCWSTQETLDMMRLRYGDNFCPQHAGH